MSHRFQHLSCAALLAAPQIPFSVDPDWVSSDQDYATGCAFVDLDLDGWEDLVVANGNDMNRERMIVYYNQGDGTYPNTPDWSSGDIDYNGHLSVGDVNGDGWPDVAVSVFLGAAGFSQKGRAKLYLNNGAGTLESTPSWLSSDRFYSFSLALGDADGDGDLDLAVATGEAYYNSPDKNRIYFNDGSGLATTPGWLSTESDHSMDVAWGDLDGDGDLDLAFCNAESPLRVYYSTGSGIQTSAGWSASSPSSPNGNSISLGDVTGDGYLDIAFSDNSQLGGSGRFMVYEGDGLGGMGATPAWQSQYVGYVSGVVLADAEGDGDLDVIGGSWWGEVRMYLNDAGNLATTPDFISNTDSVVEAIPLGDPDRIGLHQVLGESHAGNGQRRVFYCERAPLFSVQAVVVDGTPLSTSQYTYERETGWISLAVAPTLEVVLDYTYTTSVDFAVSNWDSNLGNFVFYRRDAPGDVGSVYCPGVPNSTGLPGLLVAGGSAAASGNNLTLYASQLPVGQYGYFLTGLTQGLSYPPGCQGTLCLGGNIGRYNWDVGQGPTFELELDLTSMPMNPSVAVQPGETWNFQAWYRDVGSTSNFTDALEVTFF